MMIDYVKTLEALRLLFDVDNFGIYHACDRDIVLSADKTYPTGDKSTCVILNLHYIASNRLRHVVQFTESNSALYALTSKFFEMMPYKRFISFNDKVFYMFPADRETVIRFIVDELLEMLKPGGDGVYIGSFVHGKKSGRRSGEKLYDKEIKNVSYEELMIMYDLNT